MSMHEDFHTETPGTRGHTKSTWRNETSLRGLLLRLIKENPDADDETLAQLYIAKVEMSSELIHEAARRCFDNDLAMSRRPTRAVKPRAKPAAPEGQATAAATQAPESDEQEQPAATFAPPPRVKPQRKLTAAEVVTMKAQIVKVVFLDLLMPNGKKLRHCTGLECKQMGGIFGAALNAVGALVGDELIVGDKLNEAEVAGIFASNTKAN